ncbi:dynein regulatory complex protein 1-like [Gouania willdenowi]|uniref:dynein regulatory complex protein 1-like n=1 Tax=Gouania willdenowi TaxID=441366 RepID=UPI00105493BF|nr:dynein regulatory complex protein 1-like [Gouania willdenowi]
MNRNANGPSSATMEDKKRLVEKLKRELKNGQFSYEDMLKKNAEETDLKLETMKDKYNTLTKEYRKKLAVTEATQQEQFESLFSEKETVLDDLGKIWQEVKRMTKKREKVSKNNEIEYIKRIWECFELTHGWLDNLDEQLGHEKNEQDLKKLSLKGKVANVREEHRHQKFSTGLQSIKQPILSVQAEMKKVKAKTQEEMVEHAKNHQCLTKKHKRYLGDYIRIQNKAMHLKVAEDKKFEEVWRTLNNQVNQLAEKALKLNSLIRKKYLGLTQEHPSEEASQNKDFQHNKGVEEGDMIIENIFLLEDDPEEKVQMDKKLDKILRKSGIEEKDLPKLVQFLRMNNKPAEEVVGAPCDTAAMKCNDILPALKSFLKQNGRSRVKSVKRMETAHWKSLAYAISRNELKQLDAVETLIQEYIKILKELSDVVAENERQKQLNAELRYHHFRLPNNGNTIKLSTVIQKHQRPEQISNCTIVYQPNKCFQQVRNTYLKSARLQTNRNYLNRTLVWH